MESVRWERVAASTGIAFVILRLALLFAFPPAPHPAEDVSAITAFYQRSRAPTLVGGYLDGITALLFLWFAATLRSVLERVEGGTARLSALAFGGAVAFLPTVLIADAASGAIAYRVVSALDPAAVRALFDLQTIAECFETFPMAAFTAGAALVAAGGRGPLRWLGWSGCVLTLALLVAGGAVMVPSGPFSPRDVYSTVVRAVWLLWVLGASGILITSSAVPIASAQPLAGREPVLAGRDPRQGGGGRRARRRR